MQLKITNKLIRSDTESAGRYSRSEVDNSSGHSKKPRIILSQLFRRNKDKVSGTDTDTMRTVVNVDDEKVFFYVKLLIIKIFSL